MKTAISFCLSFSLVCILNAQSPSIEWQNSIGGSNDDYGTSIIATPDGGYITAGRAKSNDGDVTGNHGDFDYWVVKLDGNGEIEWQRCYGGSERDFAHSILNTTDGGFIVAGHTLSNDGDISFNHGGYDVWIVKIDSIGNIDWEKTYGTFGEEYANCIVQASIPCIGSTTFYDKHCLQQFEKSPLNDR